MAGVQLADQGVANQLVGSKALDSLAVQPDSEQPRKDRDALNRIAEATVLSLMEDVMLP
jgi:hypothetical protein